MACTGKFCPRPISPACESLATGEAGLPASATSPAAVFLFGVPYLHRPELLLPKSVLIQDPV